MAAWYYVMVQNAAICLVECYLLLTVHVFKHLCVSVKGLLTSV